MGDSQEDPTAQDLAVGDRTAAVRGVDSQEVHMEEVHMVAALTAMAAIAKSEFQHPHLGIHHTTYFAH